MDTSIMRFKEKVEDYKSEVSDYVAENTGKVVAMGAVAGAVAVGGLAIVVGTTKIGGLLLMTAGVVVLAQGGLVVGGFCGFVWSVQEKSKAQSL